MRPLKPRFRITAGVVQQRTFSECSKTWSVECWSISIRVETSQWGVVLYQRARSQAHQRAHPQIHLHLCCDLENSSADHNNCDLKYKTFFCSSFNLIVSSHFAISSNIFFFCGRQFDLFLFEEKVIWSNKIVPYVRRVQKLNTAFQYVSMW
jgi:hypothetical protein